MTISILKNFGILAAAETVSKVITFAAFAYLARLLGPAGFGTIEWVAAVIMCVSLVIDQGFSSYGAREIARNPADTSRLLSEIVTARSLLSAFCIIILILFLTTFSAQPVIRNLLLVYGLSLVGLPFLFQWVFQGHDMMRYAAAIQVIRQSVFATVVFLFVRVSGDLIIVGAAESAGVAAAALFGIWSIRRVFGGLDLPRPHLSARLFREGVPIGISQMFWVTKMFGATMILGLVATSEDTGYFAGAMRILIAVHTFVWLYYFNLLPTLSRSWVKGFAEMSAIISRSLKLVVPASLAVAIVWVAGASFTMTFVYGSQFSAGGPALQIMAGICVFAAVSGHFRFGLIAAGRQNAEMLTAGFGAIAALILVPAGYFYGGVYWAAAGLLGAEFVVLASSWLLAYRLLVISNENPGLSNAAEVPQ